MELTEGQTLAELKIQRGIFHGDSLSPLLFVIAIMSLNYIFRKCTAGYRLTKSQEKLNHLMYIYITSIYLEKWKRTGDLIQTVKVYSLDMGME